MQFPMDILRPSIQDLAMMGDCNLRERIAKSLAFDESIGVYVSAVWRRAEQESAEQLEIVRRASAEVIAGYQRRISELELLVQTAASR